MRRFMIPLRSALLVSAGALAGCGGGFDLFGIGYDSVEIPSVAAADGFTISSGFAFPNAGGAIMAGDNAAGSSFRGFVRFDISGIPSGATIQTATLRLYQGAVLGAPYPALGAVLVDHVDLGAGLDSTDHAAPALQSNIGAISVSADLGTKTLDVTGQVAADLAAARTTSDFRIRFTLPTDLDGIGESARFDDAEDNLGVGPGGVPVLLVTYS